MTVFGGGIIYAADINRLIQRVATTKIVSDSSTWDDTPEVVAASVSATLVNGQKYMVWFTGRVSSDVNGDATNARLREDSVSGTQFQLAQWYMPTNSGNGWQQTIYGEYTAVASASKTFVLTAQRSIGTGVAHRVRASATAPGYLILGRVIE